jgi:hydroxyacylglutathione hydrolase
MPTVPTPKLEIVVVTPFQQNCQLLYDPDTLRGVVVDPGGDVPKILARVQALGLVIEAILLTHGHLDHAGGADELRQALPPYADKPVPVIGPDPRDLFLLNGITAQATSLGIPGMRDVTPDRILQDGNTLHIAGCTLDVLHVPGHTPGHLVFVDRDRRFALVGDTLFQGSVGRTDFPYCDGPGLLHAIRTKLLSLGDDLIIVPGHGATSTIGAERRSNPFLR